MTTVKPDNLRSKIAANKIEEVFTKQLIILTKTFDTQQKYKSRINIYTKLCIFLDERVLNRNFLVAETHASNIET